MKIGKEMATHSNILTWRIPWTEEPGRLHVHGVTRSMTQLANTYTQIKNDLENQRNTW